MFSSRFTFQAKRHLRSVIWGQFRATGKLFTAFFTRFGFLRIRANLRENDSCAECFDANFKQQDNCARCFAQVLAFQQKIPILINRTVAHAVSHRLYFPNNTGQFEAKRQLRSPTSGQFSATAGLRTVFWTN